MDVVLAGLCRIVKVSHVYHYVLRADRSANV
jgi:hypothetical protein